MSINIPVDSWRGTLAVLTLVISVVLSENAFGEDEAAPSLGEQKYAMYCTVCHKKDETPPLLAPPSFAVVRRYSMEYRDDKEAFVKAIVSWVREPSEETSLMVGAREKFGLMPAFPYPEEDLVAIGEYLYDAKFEQPENCDPNMNHQMGKGGGANGAAGKKKQ